MPKTPTDVRQLAEKADVKIVDVKFIDLPGVWQHFSFPVEDLTDDIFEDGLGFDGSSGPGIPRDPRKRHAPYPRPGNRPCRPATLCSDVEPYLQRAGPHHTPTLHP